MSSQNTLKLIVLIAICFAVNGLALFTWDVSYISNDGVQYLSTADNWLKGNGFSTGALIYTPHFQGVLPAPQTVWPTGYSFVIGLISLSGIPLIWSALLLNFVTHALAALLVFLILRRLSVSGSFSAFAAVLFYLLSMPWSFVSGLMTEPVFITLMLATLLLLPGPGHTGWLAAWFGCGLLMAGAIYVRYSMVFFTAGVGIGLFLYAITCDRPTLRRSFLAGIKIGLMLVLPVLAFFHLMYRTQTLIGTLDRYSGARDPETLMSTMRLWLANSAELMGFGHGAYFGSNAGVTLFFVFACLIVTVLLLFVFRSAGRLQERIPASALSYSKQLTFVIICHTLTFALYLTYSSMTDSPLEIINRYLYQLYCGVFILFSFMVYCLLQQKPSTKFTRKYSGINFLTTAIVAIYLFAQINELATSRAHYFNESKTAAAVMQLAVSEDTSLKSVISTCFSNKPETSIWSTHGQHIHLHTGQPTITRADIYTRSPFSPVDASQTIDSYNVQMFVFVGDQQHPTPHYRNFMAEMRQWAQASGFEALPMLQNRVLNGDTVDVFVKNSACQHG